MNLQHEMHPSTVPFVDEKGQLTILGRSLVQILWRRTGNAPGVSSDDLAFLSVLNSLSAPQGFTARSEAHDAFLASIQSLGAGTGSTGGSGASDAEFLALAPTPTVTDFSEPELFALMQLGPIYALIQSATDAGGTVTSVGLSAPAIFTVGGSPVTTSGTLTLSLATQAANLVWAGPTTGAAAAPTFRSLVTNDLPDTAVTPGTYGDATHVAQVTIDQKGRITSASSVSITGGSSGRWEPLTNGDPINPELIFDASGDVVMGLIP